MAENMAVLMGFLMGVQHVISGPDHLAAIPPLILANGRRVWQAGMLWGIGHAFGLIGVGLIALLLRDVIELGQITQWGERVVGLSLIGLGVWGGYRVLGKRVHLHQHTHQDETHAHLHTHAQAVPHGKTLAHSHPHASLAIGVVHGVAGSAQILVLIIVLLQESRLSAILFVTSFVLGSILAMTGISVIFGVMMNRLARDSDRYFRLFALAASALAVLIGVYWVIR